MLSDFTSSIFPREASPSASTGSDQKNKAEATAVNDLVAGEFAGEELAGFTEKAVIEGESLFQSPSIKATASPLSMLKAFALAE